MSPCDFVLNHLLQLILNLVVSQNFQQRRTQTKSKEPKQTKRTPNKQRRPPNKHRRTKINKEPFRRQANKRAILGFLKNPNYIDWAYVEKEDILADTKSTPCYSPGLHLSVIKNRPDRGQLICSNTCSKKL